jgi:copper resistance protein B
MPVIAAPSLAQSPDHRHAHVLSLFQADQLEYRQSKHGGSVNWDFHAWIGTDDEKFYLKSEGKMPTKGALEEAEIQALYSWRISDFLDAQAGIRYDYRPGPQRGFAVFGVQGMAPYFIEVDAALFVSHKGHVSALKGQHDLLSTQVWPLRDTEDEFKSQTRERIRLQES